MAADIGVVAREDMTVGTWQSGETFVALAVPSDQAMS